MSTLPPLAASFTEVSGGVTALIGVTWALASGINSWREAPNRARLTGSQANREDQALWVERVESLRLEVQELEARLNARDTENDRLRGTLDMVRGQIESLRQSKDEFEMRTSEQLRQGEARILRLEAQVRQLGAVPVP